MLRSFKTLTGALCLFAYATTLAAPAAMASGSGSEPILHVIDPDKQVKTTDAVPTVGSGKKPILHVVETDKQEKPAKKTKTASVKRKASPKKTRTASAPSKAVSKSEYAMLIRKAAAKHGVPVKIAKAVVEVESNFNPRARGSAGEVGLMQIKPATARGIGYRGSTTALYDPATNLEWGMKYLAGAHKRAGGDVCGTILRYNAGHYAKRMNPVSRRYCTKVKRIMASS
ncbi:lytic transglycosylase domain-containing protein [Roseibium sp. CAU 1639]|uniref:Lytic transglycosylase domain-containing protein n=2 Tax=Roseibium sediminicola TaxID=2933272 RepID=A0ABT0GVV1_9HYPH|nr:lytic transglycosylase domain-containing protein [Roseibium sp. CAU 1639]MCK7613564.1 lytic transglycosylase domain-containing protein [Roseibium sp. CAU 1639]